jgi:hypothetical protein
MPLLPPSPAPSNKLDLRIILEVPLRQFTPWFVTVLLVRWAGFPGVICVTPLAWLIALRVGILCVSRSTSTSSNYRLQEAVLAGAWFGLLPGLLFWVIAPRMGPTQASEQTSATIITLSMLLVGMSAGAGCSLFTAYQFERRGTGS